MCIGGAEGDRTPDLIIANDTLSQLSYCPIREPVFIAIRAESQAGSDSVSMTIPAHEGHDVVEQRRRFLPAET